MRFYPSFSVRRVSASRLLLILASASGIASCLSRAARAQINFSLTYSSATTTASSEAYFYGTITNTSSNTIYLNGLTLTQNANTTPQNGVFTTDSSPFYSNPNFQSVAGNSSVSGQLFGIMTSSSFNASSQFYGTATLNGGTMQNTSMDTLGTPQNFYVSSSAMPEPSAIALMAGGVSMVSAGISAQRRSS